MQAEARPHGRETAKVLPSGEPVSAFDALRFSGGRENRNIIAALRMSRCCKHFAVHGVAQQPASSESEPSLAELERTVGQQTV